MSRLGILAAALVCVAGWPSAAWAQLATLAGTITDASTGNAPPSDGIQVTTCSVGGLCRAGSPDAAGHYTIGFVIPGSYYVKINTPSSYVPELFDGIPCVGQDCLLQDGTLITLAAGETRVIDFSLMTAGHIVGTVTNAATGLPMTGDVFVYNAQTSPVTNAPSDASGHYDVGALATGSYFVVALGSPDFYAHLAGAGDCDFPSCRIAGGSAVPVTAGASTSVDVALTARPASGQISGRVTDAATGAPISGSIQVSAGLNIGGGVAVTAPDGSYTIRPVIPGTYTVTLTNSFTDFALTVRTTVLATRTAVVPPGANVELDFAVTRFDGSISGSLIPATGAAADSTLGTGSAVRVYDRDGMLVTYAQVTFAPGSVRWPATYVVSGLAPGTYYIRYVDEIGTFHSLLVAGGTALDQTFGFGPCVAADCDVRRGTPIQITAGAAVTGIDLPVVPAGSIVEPAVVQLGELYDSRGVLVDPQLLALRPGGTLAFLTLPPDTYFLRTPEDCRDCAATSLRPIQVHAGESVTIAPVPVEPTFRITGTIRDSTSMAPLSTILVTVSDARAVLSLGTGVRTDRLGQYTLSVAPGIYVVQTSNARGFVDKTSALITVGTSDVNGVDFVLDPVTGLVIASSTDTDGVPLTPLGITYFDAAGHVAAHAATASVSGASLATSLPSGTYFARTDPVAGRVMQLSGGLPCLSAACDPTSGAPITVTAGSPASLSFNVPACGAPEISPAILASAVVGHPYRQVLASSHPSSGFLVTGGILPAGVSLELETGVLAGTPMQGGVFDIAIAAVDGAGCAGTRTYTLQVAQCAFTLSPASATVSASGQTFDVTASDVCGFAAVTRADPWVTVSAASVTSGAPLQVTVAPNTSPASRASSIVIGRRVFVVRQPGRQPSPPFGSLDGPVDGSTANGSIAVGGWALDDIEVTHVRIYRDAVSGETGPLVFVGDAVFVDGARPDVERLYPSLPFNSRAGWGYLLLTNMLPNQGNGTFRLHAIAEDAEGNLVELGARTIVAANSAATAPFGAIDTPAQGEIVSGATYINFGWALTPRPKSIATDGSTIHVLIDGVDAGTVTYNNYRADVSTLFPGLANSSGPVGFRPLDTTTLAEGVHTIAWIVTDSDNVKSGVGSRYFTVANSADAQPAGLRAGADIGRSQLAAALKQDGQRSWSMTSLSRLMVDLSVREDECAAAYAGYLVVNGVLRALPAGAALNARGRLTWQPGPAFHGHYDLLVVRTDCSGAASSMPIAVTIK